MTTQDLSLYNLIKFYAKNWMWIILLTVLGSLAGFAYSNYVQTPLYKSDATLLIVNPSDSASITDTTSINNYVELFKSRRVLEPVIASQNLNMSYDDVVKSIDASSDKDTEVIKVSFATNDASASKSFIEGSVVSFKEQVVQLYSVDNIQIVDNASLATAPYNIHKEALTALSAISGFVVSVIILFFAYDYRLGRSKNNTPSQLEKTDEYANMPQTGNSNGAISHNYSDQDSDTKPDVLHIHSDDYRVRGQQFRYSYAEKRQYKRR